MWTLSVLIGPERAFGGIGERVDIESIVVDNAVVVVGIGNACRLAAERK